MSDLFDLTAQRLLEDNLWVDADASDDDKKKKRYYSLRKSLIESVIDGARKCADERNLDGVQFEDLAFNGVSVVDDLQYALLQEQSHTPSDWNFWRHERNPGQIIRQDKKPYMARDTVEECATRYLNLPYRAPVLERTLVDVLVALEMYAYGEEMVAPRPAYLRWLPARSPLHQIHALLGYIAGVFWNGLILLGLAYLASVVLPSIVGVTAASWVSGILIGLFVLAFCLSTLFLPYYWWQQSKGRRNVRKLMTMMIQTYSELGSEGALSTKRIREIVSRAADAGVMWPGPLYAILDDNLGRTGRL